MIKNDLENQLSVYKIGAVSSVAMYLLAKNNTEGITLFLRVRRNRRSFPTSF